MAKQAGKILITGTIDDMTFYKMDGVYYVRMKSSLSRDKVRKSPAFARTMKSANELATASVTASKVYRTIAKDKRKVTLYRKMTGMAKLLFAKGESNERVTEILINYTKTVLDDNKTVIKRFVKPNLFNATILKNKSRKERKYLRAQNQKWPARRSNVFVRKESPPVMLKLLC